MDLLVYVKISFAEQDAGKQIPPVKRISSLKLRKDQMLNSLNKIIFH